MGFGESISTCLSKYVTFSGRAIRSEYWYFVLFGLILSIVAAIIDAVVLGTSPGTGTGIVGSLVSLGLFLPSISAAVRRLHDLDKSGWWWWLWLIPIIGWIIMIIWACSRGTQGTNRFGPDPLGGADAEVFS